MAGEYVFQLEQLTKQHGKDIVFEDVTLAFFFGAKIGVIGGNGSGKSTLLKIMAGIDKDFSGHCHLAKNTAVGYLPQEPDLDAAKTVGECVEEGVSKPRAVLNRYDEICGLLGTDLSKEESDKIGDEMGRLQEVIDANDLWELDHQVEMAMEALRLPPSDMPVTKISGGEKRRVALCRLLLSNPAVLLLDEPTNHLDAESVAWIEAYLMNFKGTVVVVTHDRYFLSNVTKWILELTGNHAYPYKGNYEAWLEQKQQLMERDSKQATARKKLMDQELSWIRMNAQAKHSRNRARIKRYEELAGQQIDTKESNITIQIPSGKRLGDIVVRADTLTKAFGDRILFEDVSFDLPRGGIVGIVGGNGAGKTTLFKIITGQEEPTSGSLTVGETVEVSYVDQTREALNAENTVYEEITGGEETIELGNQKMSGRAYCARFNLKGGDQQKKVGTLSGGERNRVHLAKLVKRGGNLLLLDEPTNDLDVDTLRSLEEGLASFGGCAVIVSHDRWFLDRVATHILAFEGDSNVSWFEGNYQEFHEHRRKLYGDEADRPHRVHFKPIRHS